MSDKKSDKKSDKRAVLVSEEIQTASVELPNAEHLRDVNWGVAAFPIGVDTGADTPWLRFSLADLRVLHLIFHHPIGLPENPQDLGHTDVKYLPMDQVLATLSPQMQMMAQWLDAALDWMEAREKWAQARQERSGELFVNMQPARESN